MMELKITSTKIILIVFLMILMRPTLQMDTATLRTIEKVEKSLLSALGMKRKPVANRGKTQIPRALINLYEKTINHEYESTSLPLPGRLTGSANTARTYSHQESAIDEKFPHNHKFRLNFDLLNFPKNEIVTSAELKLTIVPNETRCMDCGYQQVLVYDIVKPGIKNKTKPILRLVDIQFVSTTTNKTTISLDVLPIVERWLSDYNYNNYGLLVDVKSPSTGCKITTSHVRLKRSLNESNWGTVRPLLFLYSDDVNMEKHRQTSDWTEFKRKKRSSQHKHKRLNHRNECSRRQLYVDFEKVGWKDWITAPNGYDAYYCAGECPSQFGDHLNTTNHAIVQSLMNTVYPYAIPKPCCVPTSLSSISILYEDGKIPILKTYQNMVVVGCGCR